MESHRGCCDAERIRTGARDTHVRRDRGRRVAVRRGVRPPRPLTHSRQNLFTTECAEDTEKCNFLSSSLCSRCALWLKFSGFQMKLPRPFFRLPLRFDAERLRTEVAQFSESDWQRHPSEYRGNSAIRLITALGEETD